MPTETPLPQDQRYWLWPLLLKIIDTDRSPLLLPSLCPPVLFQSPFEPEIPTKTPEMKHHSKGLGVVIGMCLFSPSLTFVSFRVLFTLSHYLVIKCINFYEFAIEICYNCSLCGISLSSILIFLFSRLSLFSIS